MASGACQPAAFLNSKGKLVGTCLLARVGDAIWLDIAATQVDTLAEMLERYHFTERLTIKRIDDWVSGEVLGPPGAASDGRTRRRRA